MEQKIALVLRALHLGDFLVAVPALRALRRGLPDHRIVLATRGALAPLVECTGAVDALLPTAEPAELAWPGPAPDLAVNLHGTGPQSHRALDALAPRRRIGFRAPGWDGPTWDDVAARHPHERERWCALLAAYGIPADPTDLRLPRPEGVRHSAPESPDSRAGISRLARTNSPTRGSGFPDSRARIPRLAGAPVLVHPGARYAAKRWPAERFAAVAAALDGPETPVLLTGTSDERDLAVAVATAAGLAGDRVLAGSTDLAELCTLVADAALVVSGDTGVAHLAWAFGTPSVTLFGPVDPTEWGPPPDGPHATLGDPHLRRGDPFADDPDPALLAVPVSDVLNAAERRCALRTLR